MTSAGHAPHLEVWLSRGRSIRDAFYDQAAEYLPSDPADERPYVALDLMHLAR